jgi:hypothetical protein
MPPAEAMKVGLRFFGVLAFLALALVLFLTLRDSGPSDE